MTHSFDGVRPAHGPNVLHQSAAQFLARFLVTGVLAVLLSTAHVVSTPAPATAAVSVSNGISDLRSGTYERRVRQWINVQRDRHGLRPVRRQWCANRYAERWTAHLVRQNRFYHQSMRRVLNRCNARYAGETLARGHVWPYRIVRMWMNSPGHRRILLSKNPNRIGIAARLDRHGRWVVTADFLRR